MNNVLLRKLLNAEFLVENAAETPGSCSALAGKPADLTTAASRTRRLGRAAQASAEIIDRILDGWPGVFSDSE